MKAVEMPSSGEVGHWAKALLSKMLPLCIKAELLCLRRAVENIPWRNRFSTCKGDASKYVYILAERFSPMERVKGAIEPRLQKGKERNVAIASRAIDRTVLEAGQVFSYHRLVGRPSRWRGFRSGLQLLRDEESEGIGGGLCQISNMLFQLAAEAGMLIVERHRHGLDLFPDHVRTAPFGCGATVRYNYNDLRFENPLPYAVIVNLQIVDEQLRGSIAAPCEPDFEVLLEERDHRFYRDNGWRMRENKIYRVIASRDGMAIKEELLAHNRCRVMY
ncbi:MAG: VanW family protein [Actinobacteria bacterium]|nr:VanW family protein [Actinomycetota bacterium]